MSELVRNILFIGPVKSGPQGAETVAQGSVGWQKMGNDTIVLPTGERITFGRIARPETRFVATWKDSAFAGPKPVGIGSENIELHYSPFKTKMFHSSSDEYRKWAKRLVMQLGNELAGMISNSKTPLDAMFLRPDNTFDVAAAVFANMRLERKGSTSVPIILNVNNGLLGKISRDVWLTGLETYIPYGDANYPSNVGLSVSTYQELRRAGGEEVLGLDAWATVRNVAGLHSVGHLWILAEIMSFVGVALFNSHDSLDHFFSADVKGAPFASPIESVVSRNGNSPDSGIANDTVDAETVLEVIERVKGREREVIKKSLLDSVISRHARLIKLDPYAVRDRLLELSKAGGSNSGYDTKITSIIFEDLRGLDVTKRLSEITRALSEAAKLDRRK